MTFNDHLLYKGTQDKTKAISISQRTRSPEMTSQIPKTSGNCRKIKLQNFGILRYHSPMCYPHVFALL